MTELHRKCWLNATVFLLHRNNTNSVRHEGRFIYSKAEKETSFPFFTGLRH